MIPSSFNAVTTVERRMIETVVATAVLL